MIGTPEQAALFEPRADDCPDLALGHVKKAEAFRKAASIFKARGWETLAEAHAYRAMLHEEEAECLAEYAHLLRLAKVST